MNWDTPLDKIEFVKCCRTFHFGGDAASLSSWIVKVPVFIYQQVGIQALLGEGTDFHVAGQAYYGNSWTFNGLPWPTDQVHGW